MAGPLLSCVALTVVVSSLKLWPLSTVGRLAGLTHSFPGALLVCDSWWPKPVVNELA